MIPNLHERRVIGRYGGGRPGPFLLVVSALHGNEPAGVRASRAVFERLRDDSPEIRGEVLFLVGNRQALAAGCRFVERDLNRIWTPERIRRLRKAGADLDGCPEDREQHALLGFLEEALRKAEGEACLLDLHTSSADGRPFLTVGDTLRNRAFSSPFPLPKILGLEEQVDGSLLEYLNNRGMVTVGLEAGRHDDPAAEAIMTGVIRLVMVRAGILKRHDVPEAGGIEAEMRNASAGLPSFIEVRHRHPIGPDSRFRMEPGFASFQPVEEGQVVASQHDGKVRAAEDGLILLPLYQGQGNDGFFLAREVRPLRMRISVWMRKLRVGVLLPFLPGVRRHPHRSGVLVLDTRVARWFPLDVLHLLGYRKLRSRGNVILASRRK